MNREELDLIQQIVEEAYRSDDYVDWNWVNCLKEQIKEAENDCSGSNG